jgi:hypothetical protein
LSSSASERFSVLSAALDELQFVLSRRMKLAIAAACAQREFLSLYKHEPVSLDVAERALELVWAGALGEHVSEDQFKPVAHELGDQIHELRNDMMAFEASVVDTLSFAVETLDAEHSLSMRHVVVSMIHGEESFELAQYTWIYQIFDIARVTPDEAISRHIFSNDPPDSLICYLNDVDSIDEIESIVQVRNELTADDARHQALRMERVNNWRSGLHAKWREPSGIPAHLKTQKVQRGPSSSEGIISTPGHDYVGIFNRQLNQLLFAPPHAVALGMSADEKTLYAWRVEKRVGASGVGREDYHWFLDSYAWPHGTLISSYEIADRKTIAWCWPVRIDVPISHETVIFRARSEDNVVSIVVVGTSTKVETTLATWAQTRELTPLIS